jgi:galactosamine-6-phosphate isomerase
MTWTEAPNTASLSDASAAILEDLIRSKPDAHLCLATGGSPTGTYAAVADAVRRGLNTSRVTVTKLDEWVGIDPGHPATCEGYLQEHVVGPWAISTDRYISLDGTAPDPVAECEHVSKLLERLPPFDLVVLGVGQNGHLGLNEPGENMQFSIHVATLTESTRTSGLVTQLRPVPTHGITMGLGAIFSARHVLLLISGSGKAEATRQLRSGVVTTRWPVTLLHLHPHVTVLHEPGP